MIDRSASRLREARVGTSPAVSRCLSLGRKAVEEGYTRSRSPLLWLGIGPRSFRGKSIGELEKSVNIENPFFVPIEQTKPNVASPSISAFPLNKGAIFLLTAASLNNIVTLMQPYVGIIPHS